MVAIDSLRLAIALFGLAAVSPAFVAAQSTAAAPSTDPAVVAAIYHAAGNSTQVPTDIVVTDPTSSTIWYAQSHVSISWTGTQPTDFAFQIINSDPTVRASGITLLADAKTSDGTASSRIGKIEPGTYFVRLYDPTDTTKQIALSSDFTVKAKADMPTTAPGSAASGNTTVTGASGATSATGNDVTQSGSTGQVTNNSTAANPVSDSSSTKAAKSGTSDAAGKLAQTSFTMAALVGLAVTAMALQ